MARKRLEEPMLKNWEEVDMAMKKILEAESEIEIIEAGLTKTVADAKEVAEMKSREHKDQIKKYELQIKEYVSANRGDLDGKKSKRLTFGSLGFRQSTKVMLPKMVEQVIAALKKNRMIDCITVKETVNKDILKTYSEDAILLVGGSLKKEDAFWYETQKEEIATNN